MKAAMVAGCVAVLVTAGAGSAVAGSTVAADTDDSLPSVRAHPQWLPAQLGSDATVILVPGTSDFDPVAAPDIVGGSAPAGADQYGRTVAIGLFDPYHPKVKIVDYPEAFGFGVAGTTIGLVGQGTYNDSVDDGTAAGLADAKRAWVAQGRQGTIILNGYSQSVPIAMNIAYLLHQQYRAGDPDAIPDNNVVVVAGADTRFPGTGIETVFPSVIPGAYTNGPRTESDTGGIKVISYCIRGDVVCGMANPLADPLAWAFYLAPGATIHGKFGNQVNQMPVERTWTTGNTTYVVLDGGNPWGMWLRKEGIALPPGFDDTVDRLVPVPEPGIPSRTENGAEVRTPRQIGEQLSAALGLDVPVTDPDARAAQDSSRIPQGGTTTHRKPAVPTDPAEVLARLGNALSVLVGAPTG